MTTKRYFEPWIGANYDRTRTLLLSESTYNWLDDEGQISIPQPTHPSDSIEWNLANLGENRYFTLINRALCSKENPTAEEMREVWSNLAYSIFIQESVGFGPGTRPKSTHWEQGGSHFLELIEELHPTKVIITGKSMWDLMPECSVRLLNDLQAYKLTNDSLVWCLAVPHPANRIEGFKPEIIGESIRVFRASSFPTTWP